ncbi:uncharacterized protein VDAG_00138 [Verticillium dahliae VdLs.17]|uniref:Uncharacterized protein n=1 Tax=Verticillium dahliae (strain VdLs.17 / ATCC MYA-4575 / FGSC 10137) TaxID=498257 RepID=G2WRF5_VERDV|nr:uncharacterized protein VDAG_00138 [Verticillium dahliae VdLs.17]EGY13456.1 hypothetical protein VDAG_00138 [Verticillium dahliae VdLs.17]
MQRRRVGVMRCRSQVAGMSEDSGTLPYFLSTVLAETADSGDRCHGAQSASPVNSTD